MIYLFAGFERSRVSMSSMSSSSRAQAMAQANALARRSRGGSIGGGEYVSIPLHALSRLGSLSPVLQGGVLLCCHADRRSPHRIPARDPLRHPPFA